MKRLLLVMVLTLPAGLAGGAANAGDGGCTCRYSGGDVFEGQTACIRTAKGPTLARCEKFLNNTSWKFLDQPCPTARLAPQSRQVLHLTAG